jgi:hypothetical protein
MEKRPLSHEPPETPAAACVVGEGHRAPKRELTEAERWFKSFNSAYRIRVDDHYETVIERSLPFTGG